MDFKGFSKLHVSHLRGSVRPLGGPQSHFSPFPLVPVPSLIPNPPFSLPIHAQASAGTKMEDAVWGRTWGLRSCFPLVPHPCPPPLSLAPTWAYPCRLLRLPILAASAPPRHLDPQTCGGRGWGSGDHCSRALGAPPAAVPAPALTTIFDTKDGAGRGTQKQVFPKGRRLGPSSPSPLHSPRKAHHFLRPHAGPRQGVVATVSALLRPGAARRPRPEGSTGRVRCPHQPQGAPRGPLPAPPPPPPLGAAPGPHALRDPASRH